MDYEKETFDLYNSLKKRYTFEQIVAISERLICFSTANLMFRNGWHEQHKDVIYKNLEVYIPKTIEAYLKSYTECGSDTIP